MPFVSPVPTLQLRHSAELDPLQVRQLGLQFWQRKVLELVNWLDRQAEQLLLVRPCPEEQDTQNPVDAEQVRQEEQFWQFPRPSLLNVFVGQDSHTNPEVLGCCPTLQLVQAPLLTLQLRQLGSQLAQFVVPSEKVPALQGPQISPFVYDPGLQVKQLPFVLSQVRHEPSQV